MIRPTHAGTIALFFYILLIVALAPVRAMEHSLRQQTQPYRPALPGANSGPPTIVVGFQGALFHEHVQGFRDAMAELKRDARTHTELVFNGWMDRAKAERALWKWLDTDGDGQLSDQEKQQARIILIGHSWGVPSEVAFARQLQRRNIPVQLMIEIDSVPKPWLPDDTVPANVKEAINFYEGQGLFLLRGSSKIATADPAETQILGNIKMSYDTTDMPKCKDYSFILRALNRSHIAIECDPQLWSRIESLVSERVAAGTPAAHPPEKQSEKSDN